MIDLTPALRHFLMGAMCFLAIGIILCLFRAIRGPRYTDRLVAMNAISTQVVLLICLLSVVLQEAFLMDIALLYALLNLLALAILSKLAITHHRHRKGGTS